MASDFESIFTNRWDDFKDEDGEQEIPDDPWDDPWSYDTYQDDLEYDEDWEEVIENTNPLSKKETEENLTKDIFDVLEELEDEFIYTGDGKFSLLQFPNVTQGSKKNELCKVYIETITSRDKEKEIVDTKNNRIFYAVQHEDKLLTEPTSQTYFDALIDRAIIYPLVEVGTPPDATLERIKKLTDEFIMWYQDNCDIIAEYKEMFNIRILEEDKTIVSKPYFLGYRFQDYLHSKITKIEDITNLPAVPTESAWEIWISRISFDLREIQSHIPHMKLYDAYGNLYIPDEQKKFAYKIEQVFDFTSNNTH